MQIMKLWSDHLTNDEEILNAFRLLDKVEIKFNQFNKNYIKKLF